MVIKLLAEKKGVLKVSPFPYSKYSKIQYGVKLQKMQQKLAA